MASAEPAEDARDLGLARVDAQARLADALEALTRPACLPSTYLRRTESISCTPSVAVSHDSMKPSSAGCARSRASPSTRAASAPCAAPRWRCGSASACRRSGRMCSSFSSCHSSAVVRATLARGRRLPLMWPLVAAVDIGLVSLPARLGHSRQEPFEGPLPEADAAHARNGACSRAVARRWSSGCAAVTGEPRLALRLRDHRLLCHAAVRILLVLCAAIRRSGTACPAAGGACVPLRRCVPWSRCSPRGPGAGRSRRSRSLGRRAARAGPG